MSSNPSSSPSIGSDDNPLEKTTSVGSTSSQGSRSSRSKVRQLFGSLNMFKKSSDNLRGDAEASVSSPASVSSNTAMEATAASTSADGTDTPRPSSAAGSAANSVPGLTAAMQAKVVAARLARDRAATSSEGSQGQSTSQSQSETQSSTKQPARYGSRGYTEADVARQGGANRFPGIDAAGAQKAVDVFRKQQSQNQSGEQ